MADVLDDCSNRRKSIDALCDMADRYEISLKNMLQDLETSVTHSSTLKRRKIMFLKVLAILCTFKALCMN